ncbi:prepilin peptidase [Herminiimonas arsenitoxidans]|uniref:prepilin peptidase n=1 Tax=Herminiimonas arsenitoxidans TaxID=1809410 RepID=UPI000971026C|nr:prepilin peptidase [Herminiimonas arsenitoxidans]
MTVLLVFLCITIVCYDLLFRRVPNGVLLLALLAHTGYLIVMGHGIAGIDVWQSLIGGVLALIVFVPLYAWRAMGAGDVKFLVVLGVLLGLKGLVVAWLIGSLLAGLHAVVFYWPQTWMMLVPQGLHRVMQQVTGSAMYQRMLRARQGRQGIPYAAYLAIAVIFDLVTTWGRQ